MRVPVPVTSTLRAPVEAESVLLAKASVPNRVSVPVSPVRRMLAWEPFVWVRERPPTASIWSLRSKVTVEDELAARVAVSSTWLEASQRVVPPVLLMPAAGMELPEDFASSRVPLAMVSGPPNVFGVEPARRSTPEPDFSNPAAPVIGPSAVSSTVAPELLAMANSRSSAPRSMVPSMTDGGGAANPNPPIV